VSSVDRAYFEITASVATSVLLTFVHGSEELATYQGVSKIFRTDAVKITDLTTKRV
jgi:hypothetical protein